jgi:hypothetical protein
MHRLSVVIPLFVSEQTGAGEHAPLFPPPPRTLWIGLAARSVHATPCFDSCLLFQRGQGALRLRPLTSLKERPSSPYEGRLFGAVKGSNEAQRSGP